MKHGWCFSSATATTAVINAIDFLHSADYTFEYCLEQTGLGYIEVHFTGMIQMNMRDAGNDIFRCYYE